MSEFFYKILKPLSIKADAFYSVLRLPDNEKYIEYTLRQKNGKNRLIEKPINNDLINIQRTLLKELEQKYNNFIPKSTHGFVKNRSIVTNAKEHLNGNHCVVIKLDLKDFFTSITYQRVYRLLLNLFKFHDSSSAMAFASILTRKGHLPQGAPTSPIISNMICKKLDNALLKYAKLHNAIYTRYADDITFSLNSSESLSFFIKDRKNKEHHHIISEYIQTVIHNNGFELNTKKTKIIGDNLSQYICGVSIRNNKLSVKRHFVLDLRHKIHDCEKKGAEPNQSIIVKLSFLRQINGKDDKNTIKYCSKVNELTTPPFPDSDFKKDDNFRYAVKKYLVYIDLLTPSNDYGTGFFSNGFLITSAHVVESSSNENDVTKRFVDLFDIHYYSYEKEKFRLRKQRVLVKELYLWNEIVFIKFNGIDRFKNKNLPLNGKIVKTDSNSMICLGMMGVKTQKELSPDFKNTRIINTANRTKSFCYVLTDGTIYKGMSGGPLIDTETFRVCGVNYIGQTPGEKSEDYPQNLSSVIDKTSLKIIRKIK